MLKFLSDDIMTFPNDEGETILAELIDLNHESTLRCPRSPEAFKKLQDILIRLKSPENPRKIIIEYLLRNVTNWLDGETEPLKNRTE